MPLSLLLLVAAGVFSLFAPVQPVAAAADQIIRVAPGQKEVALTFEADAWPGSITTILNTLRAHNTHLTFFLTATYMNAFPTQTRAIYAAGQEIASHGYEHGDYRGMSAAQIDSRLDHWNSDFRRITGATHNGPAFWRPPYGYSDAVVRQAALDHGYQTIYWTLDTLDTVGAPKSKTFITNRVLNTSWINLDGSIVLVHVNSVGTVAALDGILTTLEHRGLKAVTVSELLHR